MEVKPAHDDAWLTAESAQVSRYWERYRIVLVTNTRDFLLMGEDYQSNPTKLETFRLAQFQLNDFETKLQHPRTFAKSVGTALAEYMGRALSHPAALAEPRDLARLLASSTLISRLQKRPTFAGCQHTNSSWQQGWRKLECKEAPN